MKSRKAILFGAIIIVLSVIIIGISASYSFYINSVEEVNSANQGLSVTSGTLTMNFATSQYIDNTSAILVNDSDVLTNGDYTAFSISFPNNGSNINTATYNIFLTDTSMTQNYKTITVGGVDYHYLKWALYTSNDTLVTSGDFSGATFANSANLDGTYNVTNEIPILSNQSISKGTTVNYKLYVWLSYSPFINQNLLLNGKLSTKVACRAVSN